MLVWGYEWQGTYAGSMFMADPLNWEQYKDAHLLLLRWKDYNRDGLVQMAEQTIHNYEVKDNQLMNHNNKETASLQIPQKDTAMARTKELEDNERKNPYSFSTRI
ncbi:MAG: hypothetical protein HXS44_15275 [Theionarchaea archaeon]|nr:hypothetical protein [Theionarchaea archaeon]